MIPETKFLQKAESVGLDQSAQADLGRGFMNMQLRWFSCDAAHLYFVV